jgi:hypothetical protein
MIAARQAQAKRKHLLGTAHNPWRGMASRGLHYLRPVILALLGALCFAATAHAAGPVPELAPPTPPPTSGALPAIETPPLPPATEPPTETPPPPVVKETPAETPPLPATEPPTEPPPPAVGKEPPAEPPPPAPGNEPATEIPSPRASAEPATASPASSPARERAAETAPKPAISEPGPKSAPSAPAAAAEGSVDEPPPGLPSATVRSLLKALAAHGTGTAPMSARGGASPRSSRAGGLRCELVALGTRMSDTCTAASSARRSLTASSVSSDIAAASSPMAARAHTHGDHDSSAVASRPDSPTPGPAPGGASGGSAVGASGVAQSAFHPLAGLLRLGGPRAMRRLRLSCQPKLTACFVLIPERPG